jgi:antitoxin YefM
MSVAEQMSLADVKNRLSEVVDRLEREHGRVVITKHGHPAAVVISVEDLESLEETLDIMDNTDLLGDIRQSLTELAATEAEVLTKSARQLGESDVSLHSTGTGSDDHWLTTVSDHRGVPCLSCHHACWSRSGASSVR